MDRTLKNQRPTAPHPAAGDPGSVFPFPRPRRRQPRANRHNGTTDATGETVTASRADCPAT